MCCVYCVLTFMNPNVDFFYRTQVYLGSNPGVPMSVRPRCFWNLTYVTLTDQATTQYKLILLVLALQAWNSLLWDLRWTAATDQSQKQYLNIRDWKIRGDWRRWKLSLRIWKRRAVRILMNLAQNFHPFLIALFVHCWMWYITNVTRIRYNINRSSIG